MKTAIENFTLDCRLECNYTLAIQDPCLNFLKSDYWKVFTKTLMEVVSYLEIEWKDYGAEECVNTKTFYCEFGNKKYEFRLTRKNKAHASSNPISVMKKAKWVGPPDLEGLNRDLKHINHKFQEYQKRQGGVRVKVGLIDVLNWPAAEDLDPKTLVISKHEFPNIDRLFLITIAPIVERSRNWQNFGKYQLLKVW